MAGRHGLVAALVAVTLAALTAPGCGGSDDGDGDDDAPRQRDPVSGTFVGRVAKSEAFVGVVASPAAKGRDRRDVTVFVCDARRVCEWFSGAASGNEFSADAEEGDGEATGRLTRAAASGTIELSGEILRYRAGRATAAAGVYALTVSRTGRIRGASAAGVALTGSSTLPRPGRGALKLADGSRLRFEARPSGSADAGPLEPGQVRVIVLSDGRLRGIGRNRGGAAGGDSAFFLRSSRG